MGKSGDGNVQQQQEEEEEEEEDDDDEGNGRESNWPLSVRVHTPAYHVGHPPPTSHHTNRDREREREREREKMKKREPIDSNRAMNKSTHFSRFIPGWPWLQEKKWEHFHREKEREEEEEEEKNQIELSRMEVEL